MVEDANGACCGVARKRADELVWGDARAARDRRRDQADKP